jgi:NAD(P)-dependent dehydrogenase (short-subunit alcohol dehydrogenase family)
MSQLRALVTGGGSGIGRAAALVLARRGVQIGVADLDDVQSATVADDVVARGGDAVSLPVDVADPLSVERMVEAMDSHYGGIDILVHAAGVMSGRPVLEMSLEEWRRTLAINLDGTFYVTRSVARVMCREQAGTMVLLASDRGLYGHRGRSSYAASKGGVIAYMRSLALELGEHGVTVNAINPGVTDTALAREALPGDLMEKRMEQDPLGRVSTPEDIAEIVLFLSTQANDFMTGQLITTRMRTS